MGVWTQCQREAIAQLGWNEDTQDTGELLSWEGMKHPFTLTTAHRPQLRPHKAVWTGPLPAPPPISCEGVSDAVEWTHAVSGQRRVEVPTAQPGPRRPHPSSPLGNAPPWTLPQK